MPGETLPVPINVSADAKASGIAVAQASAGAGQKSGAKAAAKLQSGAAQPAHEAFPPFDKTYFASHLLWLAICFGFFYWFMARVVLPRIGGVIETRRDRIAADLDQAARLKADADAAVAAYHKNLSDARAQAKEIGRVALEQAKAKAETERKAVEAELERKLGEAETHITALRDKAAGEVDNVAAEAAAEIVRALSRAAADKDAVAQAVKSASGSAAI